MHCSHCLHWPLCQWQIVMSVCIMPGSALSLRSSVHGRMGTGWKVLLGSACTCQERTERKRERRTKRRVNPTEGKFELKKIKIGRRRTFLRSLVSMFQGSYVVVSQQQASSAAYNTRGVLCSTTGWQTIPEWTLQTVRFQKQNRKNSLKDIRQYIHPD